MVIFYCEEKYDLICSKLKLMVEATTAIPGNLHNPSTLKNIFSFWYLPR